MIYLHETEDCNLYLSCTKTQDYLIQCFRNVKDARSYLKSYAADIEIEYLIKNLKNNLTNKKLSNIIVV